MFKIILCLSCVIALAYGGIYSSPVAYHAPVVAAPIVKAAVPVATSYQSSVLISHGSVPVVAAAPVVKAAPVIAAPAIYKTPIYHAPAVVKSPLLLDHY